jgi:seryl-tRNA synthetase
MQRRTMPLKKHNLNLNHVKNLIVNVRGYDWYRAAGVPNKVGVILLNDGARFHAGFHQLAIDDVEEFDGDSV